MVAVSSLSLDSTLIQLSESFRIHGFYTQLVRIPQLAVQRGLLRNQARGCPWHDRGVGAASGRLPKSVSTPVRFAYPGIW